MKINNYQLTTLTTEGLLCGKSSLCILTLESHDEDITDLSLAYTKPETSDWCGLKSLNNKPLL